MGIEGKRLTYRRLNRQNPRFLKAARVAAFDGERNMIGKRGRPIPVMLGEPISGRPSTFTNCPPITLVHVANGDTQEHDGTSYRAMLDTGSDATCIDESVAKAIGAELFGNGIAHGFGNARGGFKKAEVSILFPSANFTYHCRGAAVMDFHGSGGQPFDVLLGRDFLEYCRFSVDGPNGMYRAEIVG